MINEYRDIPKIGERVEFASRFIPKAESLLDIGCGDGTLEYFIKNRISKIYGVDNAIKSVKESKKYYFEIKLVDLNKTIPYKRNFFDVVTCLDVIEHIKDPNKLFKETYRVLKPNGLLLLSTPNIRFSDHIYKLLFQGIFPKTSTDNNSYDGGHIHFFTFTDIRNLLLANRFKIIEYRGIINEKERGWKGKIIEFLIGSKIMREFRSPGILFIARKL